MRRHLATLGALALIALIPTGCAGSPAPASPRERLLHPRDHAVFVVAHRGCWPDSEENSLSAVQRCIALGVDAVENDVRHTRDGVAVILHDPTVDRTTDGRGAVADMDYADLAKLHLRRGAGGPNAAVTEERVPTLRDYLLTARGRIMVVMDVKDGSQAESFEIARSIAAEDDLIYFYECRNDALWSKIRPFASRVVLFPIIFETDGPPQKALAACRHSPQGLVHAKFGSAAYLPETAALVHGTSRQVWIATMFPADNAGLDDDAAMRDDGDSWGRSIAAGATMIMTNRAEVLLAYLARTGRRPATRPSSRP